MIAKKNNRNTKQKHFLKLKCAKTFNFKAIVLGKSIANLLMVNRN